MKEFQLDFLYKHVRRKASVTVIERPDHIQYTIAPEDPELVTQVVHRFGDRLEFAFPGQDEHTGHYNEAIKKALQQTLNIG